MIHHVSWPVNVCLVLSAGSLAAFIAALKGEPKDRKNSMRVLIPTFLLFLVMPLLFLSWIEGTELRRQAEYWQRKMDEQYCRRVLGAASGGKNMRFYDLFLGQSRKHCIFYWDETYLSLDEWMVRTLLAMQSSKLKFWALLERQSRFIHSNGAMNFDYWLLPFILRLKRR